MKAASAKRAQRHQATAGKILTPFGLFPKAGVPDSDGQGDFAMWFQKRRDRRIAEVRRQLAETEPRPVPHLECASRGHLVNAGTWLVALQLRSAPPTRSDYLLAPFFRRKSSRGTHR